MPDDRLEELKRLLPQCFLPDWVRLGSRLVRLLKDQRHPKTHDAVLNRLLTQARDSAAHCEWRRRNVPAIDFPPALPITARKDDIVAAIRQHQVVVIAGETGSGKTTQIPKMCLEAGLGLNARIGCTQPRRVAALSISRRIAEELNVGWGREVGCKIRFDDRSSRDTYIKMMTDGILLAETQGDPLLSEYNAIIIDEAHERSLNIDFLLGHLKGLLERRDDLKLIITSATIDTASFSKAFDDAPIIEVSGRLYPVDVEYQPFDHDSEERGDITFIDAAVDAVDKILMEPVGGDILIFMPGERDIRETHDLLEGRHGREMEIVPLFGRLSAGEQQRVFAPGARRKVVVATNIAETSLTIPGIRYVVDTGLARISRYNPRTRTRRLPVEPISQSSANQRKGRCGRVENGICIRLYSEKEFEERPAYTQPEIQRSNLAEVILRMKAFQLGEIESFPFLNPPTPTAIHGGYQLLRELGALDDARALTPLGRDLARLPIDPTLGRMLLQSQAEHAARELLIIAAGLSIQDPRERPLDKQEAADAAHRRFLDPRSDFLTLLNIWNALHNQWETLRTQNQRRKFCRANFLSYTRMREWQDLHAQLTDALAERGRIRLNESNAAYDSIHRSILTGLLGHVGRRAERNVYQTSGNRRLRVFPGSVLFDRQERTGPMKRGDQTEPAKQSSPTRQPSWIMAGEIVETSQLFARTVAEIDPRWIVELAPHICRFRHENPHWDADAGRVLAHEKATLYGLEIQDRKVAYGRIDADEATKIFIRSALVEENLWPVTHSESGQMDARSGTRAEDSRSGRFPFLEHNRQVRRKIENWQTRSRHHDLPDLDQEMFNFYAARLTDVSSIHELDRFVRGLKITNELHVTEDVLSGGRSLDFNADAFPDAVTLAGQPVALAYDYAPGEERDGVTVKLPWSLAETISPAVLEWAVPGLREKQIGELLRALPKSLRKELMPFPPKIEEIVREFEPGGESFFRDLAKFIHRRYGVEVPVGAWTPEALPAHLRPRIEIMDARHEVLAAGRGLAELQKKLEKAHTPPPREDDASLWRQLALAWERYDLSGWTIGDVPERITVSAEGAVPVYAWLGLQDEEGKVSLRLFRSREAARRASRGGIRRLVELAVHKDLAWLAKDLRELRNLGDLYAPWGSAEDLKVAALEHLKRHILPRDAFPELKKSSFDQALNEARERLRGLTVVFVDLMREILTLCRDLESGSTKVQMQKPSKAKVLNDLSQLEIKLAAEPAPGKAEKVNVATTRPGLTELLPVDFLNQIPFEQLRHVPRYLKTMRIRGERARLNPAKDQERARQLAPYLAALRRLREAGQKSPEERRRGETFRWMIEEFKVSLFAQELGTAVPVSTKRLDEFLSG